MMFYNYLIDSYLTAIKLDFFIINELVADMQDCLHSETMILTHTVYLKPTVLFSK